MAEEEDLYMLVKRWQTAFKRATDFDMWGQPVEAIDVYQRFVEIYVDSIKFKCNDVASVHVFCMLYSSTFQNFFTFTLLPGSSAHLQTPRCSEWHPSAHSPVVSILSHTRLQLCGTNFQFLPVILPLSVLSNLPWNIWCKSFSFENLFLQSHCPEIWVCISVCVCVHVACIDFENMYS